MQTMNIQFFSKTAEKTAVVIRVAETNQVKIMFDPGESENELFDNK